MVGNWVTGRAMSVVWCLTLLVSAGFAQRLPVKRYTATDGLPSNQVLCIERALDGHFWFCTAEGLARFDGYEFRTFAAKDGLPSPTVHAFLQTHDGSYWVGTSNGLCQYLPGTAHPGPSRFRCLPLLGGEGGRLVKALQEDRAGVVWVGASSGLYRLDRNGTQWQLTSVPIDHPASPRRPEIEVQTLLVDREGAIWMGTASGLCRRLPDGRVERYGERDGIGSASNLMIHALSQDAGGALWVGTRAGLLVLKPQADHLKWIKSQDFRGAGLRIATITALFRSSDGMLWVGTTLGLARMAAGGPGQTTRFVALGESQGVPDAGVTSLVEDGAGGLWVGFGDNGVVRIGREGCATYTLGGGRPWVRGFVPQPGGGFVMASGRMVLRRFQGEEFGAPFVPHSLARVPTSWGETQIFLRDHAGGWWLASGVGLYRFPAVARVEDLATTPPRAVYRNPESLTDGVRGQADIILRLFEDSRGDIWIGTAAGLSRWQRSTDRIYQFSHADGVPYRFGNEAALSMAHAFVEDRRGSVWIGFFPSGLARFDGGKLTFFSSADGLPDGPILALLVDRRGRLWAGSTREGLARIDDPGAAALKMIRYTTEQGLISNRIVSLVEDRSGRIYAGTGKGVERIDADSGRVRHYNEADGLPSASADAAFRDSSGALWFGTAVGATRLIPDVRPPLAPQAPVIRSVRVSGAPRPISDLGEAAVAALQLGPDENNVEIDFSSLRLNTNERLRYQVRLDASQAWSEPVEERSIHYAKLAAGSYRFEVRAVSEDGLISPGTASVPFLIARPVWLRWWFLCCVALGGCVVVYSVYRYRLAYLVALERMRSRLAIDLHDEVGSGLAEIAIASEVAHRDAGTDAGETFAAIAERCRELRAGMADIVFAVDPGKDKFADLLSKMRQAATTLLHPAGCRLRFESNAHAEAAAIALTPSFKRHLLLAVKEILANIVRHADATEVAFRTNVTGGALVVVVQDNGRGFDTGQQVAGNGLRNLAARTTEMGGSVAIDSAPGQGTTVLLRVPLFRRTWSRLPKIGRVWTGT